MAYKLLIEEANQDLEFIKEEKNLNEPATLYIKGPYMKCETVNKNMRIYTKEDMYREVDRYIKEMVNTKRALGEIEHPQTPEVSLDRAAHLIVSLEKVGNEIIGKSKVLTTPMGNIARCLISDGASIGMSSRALGRLTMESGNVNRVNDMRLCAVDIVSDPSAGSFVGAILESKQYIITPDGKYAEAYEVFESALSSLPRKDVQSYLTEQIQRFLGQLGKK